MFLIGIPLLLIPFVLYNMIAFLTPGVSWAQEIARIPLLSEQQISLTVGDALVVLALLILFIEIFKTARLSRRGIVDHLLATLLFAVMLAEFLMIKEAATATFFLLVVTAFVDVLAGFAITRRLRRPTQQDYADVES
jgi:hypothetical protein